MIVCLLYSNKIHVNTVINTAYLNDFFHSNTISLLYFMH